MRSASVAATWIAFALAAASLVLAAAYAGDVVGSIFATLALGVTGTVQLWSIRHLEGDPRATRFFALSSVLAAALTVTAAAPNAIVLAIGWVVASGAMIALITLGGRTAQARVALRRSLIAFGIGDVALVAAVVIVTAGPVTALSDLAAVDAAPALVVGVLIAIAAITRAASVPLHGWLPATLAAPTPVSAILHAGFVNAGALLLLRFAPLGAWTTPIIVGIAGGLTVVIAGSAMLTRPDVKGRLVHSTAAQMGFMLLACAIGAWPLALLHVVGHALYKSYRFLAAGSALLGEPSPSRAPDADTRVLRSGVASAAAAIVVVIALIADSFSHPGGALVPFIAATVWIGVWAATGGRGSSRWVIAAGVTSVASGYVLLWAAVENAFPLALGAAATPWLAVCVFVTAVLAGLAVSPAAPTAIRDYAYGAASGWATSPAPPSHAASLTEPVEYERSPR